MKIMTYEESASSFETSDMFLAATLQTLGFGISHLEWRDQQRCVFLFENSNGLEQAVRSYWDQSLCVEPQSLLNGLKSVKTRLYASR